MTISEIKKMPRGWVGYYQRILTQSSGTLSGIVTYEKQRCHESLLRSFHILDKTKEWLSIGTPPSVVLEMIAEAESIEDTPYYEHE